MSVGQMSSGENDMWVKVFRANISCKMDLRVNVPGQMYLRANETTCKWLPSICLLGKCPSNKCFPGKCPLGKCHKIHFLNTEQDILTENSEI
jgi:hypothetical protein